MELLMRSPGTDSTLIYDITSLSSYSQLISLLMYGYNWDGLELPRVNFSLILNAAQAKSRSCMTSTSEISWMWSP
jgi:hypothetical protein